MNRVSTTAQVAEHLRKQISSGELLPGTRIIELNVSGALGVSRSPVREALMQLSQEGLVTIIPYRGAIVARLDKERLVQLFDFRVALEEFAVERVVASATQAEVDRLLARVARIRKAVEEVDFAASVEADLQAHQTIVALAENALLERTFNELINQLRLYIRITSTHYESVDELASEHELLCDAIARRDTAAAKAILREHIAHGFDAALKEL